MVRTTQQFTEFSQLLYVSGGRYPCCAGRAYHAVLTALVCTWLVFLVTLHIALCFCVFVWPKMLRIMAGTHHSVAGFTGDDVPPWCAPVYCCQAQDARHHGRYGLEEYRKFGFSGR